MSFEIIFITEGADSTPAAEVQFGGQRLCVLRFSSAGISEIEFVQDAYAGRDVDMTFSLAEFQQTLQLALDDLASWRQNLSGGRAEA